jgi:hypothetical protein
MESAMNRLVRRAAAAVVTLAALGALACASGPRKPSSGAARGTDVITAEEMQSVQFSNLFDMVQALRFRWLQARGPDSINLQSGAVQVRLDDTGVGGVEMLRNIAPAGVVSIRWVDPTTAAGRWGMGYGHGAIVVSTRRQPPKS